MNEGDGSPEDLNGRGKTQPRRTRLLIVRVSAEEKQAIDAVRARTGLSAGALVRQALLGIPPPPGSRRPTAEAKAIGRLLGQLAKIAGNIRQIDAHSERFIAETRESIDYALRTLAELRYACLKALGHESGSEDEHGPSPASD